MHYFYDEGFSSIFVIKQPWNAIFIYSKNKNVKNKASSALTSEEGSDW